MSSCLVSGWEGTDSQFIKWGPPSLAGEEWMAFDLSLENELLAVMQQQVAIFTLGHRWVVVIKSAEYLGARHKILLFLAHSSKIYLNKWNT